MIPLFFVFLAILTLWIWPDMGFWALIAVSPLLIIMVICALFLFQGGAVGPLGWNNETKVAYMESRRWKGIQLM